MYRSRAEKKFYQHYLADRGRDECAFCNPPEDQLIEQGRHFFVLRNIFPYSFWDLHKVTEHLMIVPRQHVESIGKLPDRAKVEFTRLIDKYEGDGYNIYGRTAGSAVKTVPHQHTHCIRTGGRRARFMLWTEKPYLRWVRW